MQISFDASNHLAYVPYDLLNYHIGNSPKLLARYNTKVGLHDLQTSETNSTESDVPTIPGDRRGRTNLHDQLKQSQSRRSPSTAAWDAATPFQKALWTTIEEESLSATSNPLIVFPGASAEDPGGMSSKPSNPAPIYCSPGSKNLNEFRCESCSVGKFTPDEGLNTCLDCPIGYYADEQDMSECTQCPEGSTTWNKGSVSATECMCDSGYFAPIGSGAASGTALFPQPSYAGTYMGCFKDCGNATAGIMTCPQVSAEENATVVEDGDQELVTQSL